MRSVVNKAFHQIQQTGKMTLFKSYRAEYRDGEQLRDFVYVKDAVEATIYLAEQVNGGGLFNLGAGEANTWVALANAVFAALRKPAHIEFVEMPEKLREKYQYYTRAEITKLRSAGYTRPFRALTEAVADYVDGYLLPDRHLGDE
jgi:ADP-L-glycero-D-manno-heptose 6-epimerase